MLDPQPAFDPNEPTQAVGSWPSLDPRRLRLSPLAWLFVGCAVLAGWQYITAYTGVTLDLGATALVAAVTAHAVLPILVPAALLRRIPDAVARLPLLMAGLAIAAAYWTYTGLVRLVPPADPGSLIAVGESLPLQWLPPIGALLVGAGLLRLRPDRPARTGLLLAMELLFVALAVGPFLISRYFEQVGFDASVLVAAFVWPAASAFTAWVAVAAWLDRVPWERFWRLLAVGVALEVATGAASVLLAIAVASGSVQAPANIASDAVLLLEIARSLVLLIAFGVAFPTAEGTLS